MGRKALALCASATVLALVLAPLSVWAQPTESPAEPAADSGLTRPAIAPDVTVSAEQWLARMNHALVTSAYSGTFVFLRDGQLDALRIEHQPAVGTAPNEHAADAAHDGIRLYSESGERVEAIADEGVVRVEAGSRVAVLPTRLRAPATLRPLKRPPAALYELVLGSQDRVAARQAQVLDIRPRDGFRYGYRLWLDVRTALLLKSLTIGSDGRAIEQLMFTTLDTEAGMPDDAGAPDSSQGDVAVTRDGQSPVEAASWQVLDVPDGFVPQLIAGGDSTHLLFSDGLARVSVYVEPLVAATPTLSGLVSRGALNAYGRVAQGQQIIAMGEAPAATVERFAQGVVPAVRGAPVQP